MRLALFCCGLMLALAACSDAPTGTTAYTRPATKGGRMCVLQCSKSRGYCGESCALDYRACYSDMQATAQKEYDAYVQHQVATHQGIDLQPHDFEHHADCDAAKKHCEADCDGPYNRCYNSCGGTVTVPDDCFFCFE